MKYQNILFDLGGVLIDLDIHRCLHTFSQLLTPQAYSGSIPPAITPEGLMGGHTSKLVDCYQVGEISTDDFIRSLQSQCRPGTTREQIIEAWFSMLLGIREEKKKLLHELVAKGKNIYVLSNINELHVDWTLSHCPELKAAKKCFFSNEMHLSKPDPRCYEKVLSESGIKAEETVYVDDLLPNIEAGKAFGFQCLQATDDSWMAHLLSLL